MRTVRIYQAGDFRIGETVALGAAQALHVGRALRMHTGECLQLFNGNNVVFEAHIVSVSKSQVCVEILKKGHTSLESPTTIHLAQAVSKGDKMEWVVQKAVELGVSSITPIISQRSVVRLDAERLQKKQQQWQAIAIAACEQCGRNRVPVVHPVLPLSMYVQERPAALHFLLSPGLNKSWRDYPLMQTQAIGLCIGPEGGFGPEESQALLEAGFNPLQLGPRVLRTETAAIAALSLLQTVCGDF